MIHSYNMKEAKYWKLGIKYQELNKQSLKLILIIQSKEWKTPQNY